MLVLKSVAHQVPIQTQCGIPSYGEHCLFEYLSATSGNHVDVRCEDLPEPEMPNPIEVWLVGGIQLTELGQ